MFCCKCQNDLGECTCPDLKERLERISQIKTLVIGPDYLKRLEERAKENDNQQSMPE